MPNIYVRSTDGLNTDDGSTWPLAKATLAGADAIDAAGDVIYVSQSHAETTAAAITLAFAGTVVNPTRVICANDAATPPTTPATGATITTTGASSISLSQGAGLFVYGLTFQPGNLTTSNASLLVATAVSPDAAAVIDSCTINIPNNSASSVTIGSSGSSNAAESVVTFKNTAITFRSNGNRIQTYVQFRMTGGSVSATFALNYLVTCGSNGRSSPVFMEGVDLSGLPAASNLVANASIGALQFKNCRLPNSWTGSLVQSGARPIGQRVSMYNCDSADTNYRMWIESYAGSIKSETAVVRSGGASDGATPISWRIDTSANASIVAVLRTDEIHIWNEVVGSPVTVTVHVITDGVTLTHADCWLEVQSLTTSGFPLSSITSDAAGLLQAAVNQDASTATWAAAGIASPVKQKLSVTVTPQEKGWISAVIRVSRPSTTIYACPKVEVA